VEGLIAPTDEALVARCRAGDDEAWNLLVERFSRYVYAICTQGFRFSTHEAEDVFQDVFAKVFEQLSRLRDDGAIRPWIAQLTRRTCIDRIRSGGREAPSDELEPVGLDDTLASLEEAIDLREALRSLSESCQEILDRFFARDESYKTIADALDLPAGTIASRISRCLDKLRSEMEDRAPVLRPVDG
jgi:RNA polymerase sigma-70 factor (ECF subfamily)